MKLIGFSKTITIKLKCFMELQIKKGEDSSHKYRVVLVHKTGNVETTTLCYSDYWSDVKLSLCAYTALVEDTILRKDIAYNCFSEKDFIKIDSLASEFKAKIKLLGIFNRDEKYYKVLDTYCDYIRNYVLKDRYESKEII